MTIQEVHYDFNLKIDEVESLSGRSFLPLQRDWLLNEAYQVYIENKLKAAEKDEKEMEDLSTLIMPPTTATPVQIGTTGVYEVDLETLTPHPVRRILRANVTYTEGTCTKTDSVFITNKGFIDDLLDDPFDSRIIGSIGRSSTGNKAFYIYPRTGQVPTSVSFQYMKRPVKVNLGTYIPIGGAVALPAQTFELPEETHPKIVSLAVQIAKKLIADPASPYHDQLLQQSKL